MYFELQIASDQSGIPEQKEFTAWLEGIELLSDEAELVIRLVDEEEGRELNHQYRKKDYATNVLSFPFEAPPGVVTHHLGDLVICVPVVEREAKEQGKSLEAHWAHLVVHGVLHLKGYDHQTEAEAEKMEDLERRILAHLGFPDPYMTNE